MPAWRAPRKYPAQLSGAECARRATLFLPDIPSVSGSVALLDDISTLDLLKARNHPDWYLKVMGQKSSVTLFITHIDDEAMLTSMVTC